MNKNAVIICGILFIIKNSSSLDYGRRQHLSPSANTDFLLHEGGLQPSSQSSTGFQSGDKRDYVSQFPALGPPVTSKSTSTTAFHNGQTGSQQNPQSSNGKRDYVAPVRPVHNAQPVTPKTTTTSVNPQHNPQSSSGKRDYVAPIKPAHTSQPVTPKPSTTPAHSQHNPQSSNGKRDYVAPQFPALKPVHTTPKPAISPSSPAGGKVQDLVHFFDGKNPNQGPPSYSSVIKDPTKGPSPTALPIQPTKPMSWSSVVSGPKNPTTAGAATPTTAKPTTRIPSSPTSHVGTSVLPSSIVANNPGANSGNSVSDAELATLSEELLRKDTNNAARYITVNYQEKTTSQSKDDRAPQPLLTVLPEAWNIPTIQKFVPLLDNYERDATVNEHVTPQERIEENAFMDAIMSTTVMRYLMTFLKNKGYVSPDPKQQRDFVKQLWFTLYSRGKGRLGSSGFEHTFVSELKNGGVSGLHNWIYFAREESANRANYLGYMKYSQLNDKGVVLKYHFSQQGVDKPVNTMFIGTSPELEIALYTLCYVTRVDNDCKLKLANKDVNVITYNYRYRSKNLVGSAYPQI